MDKLSLKDFEPLIKKATTNAQLGAIITCFEACYFEDQSIVVDDNDWVRLSRLIAEVKSAITTRLHHVEPA